MYHAITRGKLRTVFSELSRGHYEGTFGNLAPGFEHVFAGDHAFGGTRRSVTSFRRWFERLYKVFPDLQFELKTLVVKGWPWNTVAVVEWEDWASTRDGKGYRNQGVHIIRLRWGRVVSLHVFLDTQKLADACRRQAQHGESDAIAAPIVDGQPDGTRAASAIPVG
jgi:ketosteroid isomerase-like protein